MNLEELTPINPLAKPPAIDSVVKKPKKSEKEDKKKKGLWEKMWRKNRLKRPEQVAVMYLRNNGTAEPMELETKQGFFNIDGKTYHVNRDCTFSLSGDRIPLAIIPEWSLVPMGTKRWDDRSMLEKFAELQDHVLRGIRHAELVKMGDRPPGTKLSGKAIVGMIIAAIVGLVLLSSYL